MGKKKEGESFMEEVGIEAQEKTEEKFFNNLVEKYREKYKGKGIDIKQNADHIIITKKSGRTSYIRKWRKIPYPGYSKGMEIKAYIDMILSEDDE